MFADRRGNMLHRLYMNSDKLLAVPRAPRRSDISARCSYNELRSYRQRYK